VAIIPLAPALLPGSSDLPESCPSDGVGGAGAPPLLFGLAPCGVYPAPDITIGAVRSYVRVPKQPAPFHPYQSSVSPRRPRDGGMFSVALSVSQAYGPTSRHPPATLAVSEHTALRSSDFPLPRPGAGDPVWTEPAIRRGSDRPACPRKFHHRARRGSASRGERILQLHRPA
jgi:hypothetical protein